MIIRSADLLEKSIKVKQDNNFSSRRLPREILETNSVEVYYGGAPVGVPFTWESQPGTPKVKFHENPLPPLTPPPSFHFNSRKNRIKNHSKPNLFHTLLPKLNLRKTSHPPSPASSLSSSSWSSSHSVPSSRFTPPNRRGQFHEEDEYGSPVSTLCFGIGRGTTARPRGSSSNIIKVLLQEFA